MIFDAMRMIDLNNYYPALFDPARIDSSFDLEFAIDSIENFRSLRILSCLALFDDELVGFRLHLHPGEYGTYTLRIKSVPEHTMPLISGITKALGMAVGTIRIAKSVYCTGARVRGNLNGELVLDVMDSSGTELCVLSISQRDKKLMFINMDRYSLSKIITLLCK